MKPFTLRIILFVFFFLTSQTFATTYKELSLEDILSKANIAFLGLVVNSEIEERDGEPWTVVTFDVDELLKGEHEATEDPDDPTNNQLRLAFLGGRLPDGRSLDVTGMPRFNPGEEILLFVYDAEYYSPIVGFSQGFFQLGARGFEDEQQRVLSLSEDGVLGFDLENSSSDEVLEKLKEQLTQP